MAELSDKKKEQLNAMPIIETRISKSKDDKFIIHKIIITDIKPVGYYEAVLKKAPEEEQE